jgi:hypothetical protein
MITNTCLPRFLCLGALVAGLSGCTTAPSFTLSPPVFDVPAADAFLAHVSGNTSSSPGTMIGNGTQTKFTGSALSQVSSPPGQGPIVWACPYAVVVSSLPANPTATLNVTVSNQPPNVGFQKPNVDVASPFPAVTVTGPTMVLASAHAPANLANPNGQTSAPVTWNFDCAPFTQVAVDLTTGKHDAHQDAEITGTLQFNGLPFLIPLCIKPSSPQKDCPYPPPISPDASSSPADQTTAVHPTYDNGTADTGPGSHIIMTGTLYGNFVIPHAVMFPSGASSNPTGGTLTISYNGSGSETWDLAAVKVSMSYANAGVIISSNPAGQLLYTGAGTVFLVDASVSNPSQCQLAHMTSRQFAVDFAYFNQTGVWVTPQGTPSTTSASSCN